MTPFLIYFIKVNLAIAVLYTTYYFLLRKEKFFRLNRIILLSIILLSFLIPLLPSISISEHSAFSHGVLGVNPFSDIMPYDLPADHHKDAGHGETTLTMSAPVMLTSPLAPQQLMWWIYILVALVLASRLFVQLYRLSRHIIKSIKRKQEGIVYCYHDQPLPPFSFFHFLVFNPDSFDPARIPPIIAHEKVHIRQGHSFDLLLVEFLHAFLWVNPFMIGLKRAIKLNLEYIADERVLETGIDSRAYQYSILSCMQLPAMPLTNLFTSSKIKLRINMMNTRKTPMRNLYKYALAIPLLAGTYLTVNPLKAHATPLTGGGSKGSDEAALLPAIAELKAFAGYYQFQNNAGAYIKISASGKQLILKQLWDNKEFHFDQQSELEFSADDGHFPLKFSKDTHGAVTSVLAFNKDVWNKVDEFKPVATITLPAEQIKSFEGFYEMTTDDGHEAYIQILADEKALILRQGWDGQEIAFLPTSETSFYSKEKAFPLDFTKDQNGNVTQVTAFHKDVWKKMSDPSKAVIKKAIMLDEGQLKGIEGKYHMKSEKGEDLYITLTQQGHGLALKQSWDSQVVRLSPESPTSFFSKDRRFDIVFTRDSNGNATSALAFGRDHWDKVKE